MRLLTGLGRWLRPAPRASALPPLTRNRGLAWALPTRNGTLPPTDESVAVPPDSLHLHLRDWRQFELVSVRHLNAVETDLAAIHAIWANHRVAGDGTSSFRQMHVRQQILEPLSVAVELADLEGMLDAKARSAAFDGHAHPLRDVFAMKRGGLVFYGMLTRGRLITFGVELIGDPGLDADSAGRLQRFIEMNDLMLVHWPSRTLFPSAKAAVNYFVTGYL